MTCTEYHFNTSRSRIEIKCGSVVVAFIETEFFKHYPYFDRIADEQIF
jgi:hypothetical protein